jgi:hypothetical protein
MGESLAVMIPAVGVFLDTTDFAFNAQSWNAVG